MMRLNKHLKQSLAFVKGTAQTFLGWVHDFKKNHKNQLPLGDQAFFQAAGGDPKIFYLHGYFEFNSDEYLEIKTDIPSVNFGTSSLKIFGWNHWTTDIIQFI